MFDNVPPGRTKPAQPEISMLQLDFDAVFKGSIMIPGSRPLGFWAKNIQIIGESQLLLSDVFFDISQVVEGIVLKKQTAFYEQFHVFGCPAIWHPNPRKGVSP